MCVNKCMKIIVCKFIKTKKQINRFTFKYLTPKQTTVLKKANFLVIKLF